MDLESSVFYHTVKAGTCEQLSFVYTAIYMKKKPSALCLWLLFLVLLIDFTYNAFNFITAFQGIIQLKY